MAIVQLAGVIMPRNLDQLNRYLLTSPSEPAKLTNSDTCTSTGLHSGTGGCWGLIRVGGGQCLTLWIQRAT